MVNISSRYREVSLNLSMRSNRHIVPYVLLVKVQCFRTDLYKTNEGPYTRLIVLSMITGSYFLRRRNLTIFETDETEFAAPLTLFYLKNKSP